MRPLVAVTGARMTWPGRRGRSSRPALDGVDLTVTRGRHLALVGPSGSGKTTLVRAILGLLPLDEGRIEVLGHAVTGRRPALARLVQLVHQDPVAALSPRFSVRRAIAEPIQRLRLSDAPATRVPELVERVGLPADVIDRLPGSLSGGQCQRVAIARALAARPRLMFADEILSALDAGSRIATVDLLSELAEAEGTTYVMVSHDLGAARLLCPEMAVLDAGRVVEHGASAEVLHRPTTRLTQRLIAAAAGADR
jgi:peptide/nickel transport system ATP-binding protein